MAHLHWHIFPPYQDDPLRPIWEHAHEMRIPTPEEAEATITAIQRGL